jgi:hypothetical protein
MRRRYFEDCPSVYEIKYENGEIEDEDQEDRVIDCGDYYTLGYYKYNKSFPEEWAISHLPGTGPEQCGNCYDYGSIDGVFLGYCLNCAIYVYNCERGPGLGLGATEEEMDQDIDQDMEETQVESETIHMSKLVARLRECSDDLDYVFRITKDTVPPDDQRALNYFGIEK